MSAPAAEVGESQSAGEPGGAIGSTPRSEKVRKILKKSGGGAYTAPVGKKTSVRFPGGTGSLTSTPAHGLGEIRRRLDRSLEEMSDSVFNVGGSGGPTRAFVEDARFDPSQFTDAQLETFQENMDREEASEMAAIIQRREELA